MTKGHDGDRNLNRTSLSISERKLGMYCAVPAFMIWGLSPVYWKQLQAVPAFEILTHRIVWSFALLLPFLLFRKDKNEILSVFVSLRHLGFLFLTTSIIALNWFIFIWAINHGHVLDTSLGYFITPVVNIFLGMIFLKERLRPLQSIALILGLCSVTLLSVRFGKIPWIALGLALTFGTYGLIHKVIPVSALTGLGMETLLLSIPAAGYLAYLDSLGLSAFLRIDLRTDLYLMGSALVTGLPLLLFIMGARRVNLSTIGFLQYFSPSCTFILGVFLYREPFSADRLIAFALVWIALALFSMDVVIDLKRNKRYEKR